LDVEPDCCRLKGVSSGLSAFISKTEKSIDELNSVASQAVTYVPSPSNRREDQTRCPIVIRQWCLGGSTFSFEAFLSEGGEMY